MRVRRWAGAVLGLGLGLGAQGFQPTPAIHTVFIIVMENMQWSEVKDSPQAPFINQTLLPEAAHAEQYLGMPFLHPSLPNYLVLEAGTNFGITNDSPPAINVQSNTEHLTAGMERAGLSWKAWVEDISGNNCPLTDINLYTDAVNPTVFFHDVIDDTSNCIAHERPFGELADALSDNSVPNLNWIIPDLCDDAHSCPLSTGDQWLAQVVGMIQASAAYQNGGAIFITWDETEDGVEDVPLGLIVASPAAKAGYANSIPYTHASTLRTIEEIFGLTPYYADAATANDLSDLFNTSGLAISPQSLNFAPQALGTTSDPQTVTVTNQGSVALTLGAITAGGDFTASNDCGASLAAGAACTVAVRFTPQGLDQETGALMVNDSAPGSPQTVALSGEGLGGVLALSEHDLEFGEVAVGAASAAQTLTLSNSGTAALMFSAITVSGPFEQTGNCGATLGPGASCALEVRFSPTAAETSHGTLTLRDNAADSPQQVSLRGTGQGAIALVSAEAMSWGNQALGGPAAAQTLTVQNGGNIPLTLSAPVITGPFSGTSDCGASLAGGADCSFQLTFTPAGPGAATGRFTLRDNAPDSPQEVDLSGTGVGAVAQLATTKLDFGGQTVGTVATAMSLAVTNAGNAPLTVSGVAAGGSFTATSGCTAAVAPGGSCSIAVQFAPTAEGAASGTLTLSDNAAGAPQTVALSGVGLLAGAQLGSSSLDLGSVAVDTVGAAMTLTVTNNGNAPLTVTAVTAGGAFSAGLGTCTAAVAPGAACAVMAQFAPTAVGAATGTLQVVDNAGQQTVALTGTGLGALVQLSGAGVNFGTQLTGTIGAAVAVTLTNTGNAPLVLGSAQASGSFAAMPACAAPVAPQASCTVAVQFLPTTAGAAAGVLRLADNAGVQTVALTGTGSDLTLAADALGGGGTWTVASGQTTTGSVVMTSVDGFSDPQLTVGCMEAPAPATCAVMPAVLALDANGQATAEVVIATAGGMPAGAGMWLWGWAGLWALAAVIKRRRSWALAPLLVALAGCGGLPPAPRLSPGTYNLTVVATTSAGATRTLPLSLRVH